jgi:hypothetical protein
MRLRVRRLIRWLDGYTLVAFNPAMQFRQSPRD